MLSPRFSRMVALCLLAVSFASAQQGQIYNQFFMNPYMYNPAYAGVDGHGVIFAMYKQQWSQIADGPSLSHATFHMPMQGGIGLGFTGYRDAQGPLVSTAGKVSGSYLVNIDRKHYVRLGMSLGVGTNQITASEETVGDPAFGGGGSSFLIGDFGATYHFDHFNVGFSLPNLFSSQQIGQDGFTEFKINPLDRMLFKMNYRGHISHDIAIEPHVLYRYSNVLPHQYEVATIVHLMHVAWVGGTYRQDAGFIGLVGAKIKHKFAVGAAFELGNSQVNSLTGTGFEIHLGMHLGGHAEKKLAHVDHHRTWFSTHSDELRREKELKDRQDSIRLARQNADNLGILGGTPSTLPETKKAKPWRIVGIDLQRETENGETETAYGTAPDRGEGSSWAISPATSSFEERDRPDGKREVGVKWVRIGTGGQLEEQVIWTLIGERPEEPVTTETETTETETQLPDTQTDVPDTTVPVDVPDTAPVLTQDERPYDEIAASDQHLEVKRGNNILELPTGIYLVGGVYDNFQQAEDASDVMFRRGYREVKVGYVSARKHYYVILKSYKTIQTANQDKTRVSGTAGMKDVWVLQVKD